MVTDDPVDGLMLGTGKGERFVVVIDPGVHSQEQVDENCGGRKPICQKKNILEL